MWVFNLLFPAKDAGEQAALIREIFKNLQIQIPILYSTAIMALIGTLVATGGAEPEAALPAIPLVAILVWRAIYWAFFQRPAESLKAICQEILKVIAFTFLLSGGLSIWAQSLMTTYPDQALNVAAFSVTAALGATYGLSNFPRAALIPLVVIGIPATLRFVVLGDNLAKATGLGLLLIQFMFVRLLHAQGTALLGLIRSRRAASLEHDRAISAEDEAIRRAEVDILTGLANRAKLIGDIERHLNRVPVSDRGSVVAICDLDGFKRANDVFGHAAGDALLKAFGQRLAQEFGETATVARMGGDEFAIFWRRGLSSAELSAAGDRICSLACQPVEWNSKKLTVRTSCGFSEEGHLSASVEELLRRADTALYIAKASGRGRWKLYDEDAYSIDKRRAKLEVLLLSDDAVGELSVDYQPIFDIAGENVMFVEALARWHSRQLGAVSPSEFIVMAEALGKIEAINEALFDHALTQARSWQSNVRLSFNLSAAQISREGAAERILARLERHGVGPDRMLFEVNDAAVLTDIRVAKRELENLRRAGAFVALDDFGAGNASVAYLRDLVFDVVKIDGSLTRDIQTCTRSRQILLGLINLCHAAGAVCVAEHIETGEQLALVRAMGCDLVQGFYLSRPLAADGLEVLQSMPSAPSLRIDQRM